ncbi:hypothetical protein BH11ACT7_BH11ACT7_31260 [soil metagenome]
MTRRRVIFPPTDYWTTERPSMSDAFPNGRRTNEARTGATLLPHDGIAGLDFALFGTERLGLAMTIHTDDGDYHIPFTGEQTNAIQSMLNYLAKLTPGDREQLLNELRQEPHQ